MAVVHSLAQGLSEHPDIKVGVAAAQVGGHAGVEQDGPIPFTGCPLRIAPDYAGDADCAAPCRKSPRISNRTSFMRTAQAITRQRHWMAIGRTLSLYTASSARKPASAVLARSKTASSGNTTLYLKIGYCVERKTVLPSVLMCNRRSHNINRFAGGIS